ncbi:MAG TPA: tannase/feruloyl esterase family alpha/beta hydrolase [Alphaproteobacteria bacterium]|nr:tannase/feruloyl esterase family alpha/beta hydrolase [Alphaproteobacteria bacterium]
MGWTRVSRRTALGIMTGAVAASGLPGVARAAEGKAPDAKLDVAGYTVTDAFFDAAYVDIDEARTDFVPHRFIHGGFKGTGTRFSFHFPAAEHYQGRFLQPLEGGTAGSEYSYGAPQQGAVALGGLDTAVRLGAYLVQSNQGHVGTEKCPKGGDNLALYGWRASAETGRFARYLATQLYGSRPKYGYVFGGSGGGHRAPLCLENAPDVWAGAVPFMGGAMVDPANVDKPMIATQVIFYSALLNVQRMLRDQLKDVVDAVEPGGSGNPFDKLTVDQRVALEELYRCGYPRGAEFLIDPDNYTGQIFEWAWSAELIKTMDPGYFTDFWSQPGYAGHDTPHLFTDDIIDATVTVRKVMTAGELLAAAAAGGPEGRSSSLMLVRRLPQDAAVGVVLESVPRGYMIGAGLAIASGAAAGRTLYCTSQAGSTWLGNAIDQAGNLRFAAVKPGDTIKITNRPFLAYCSWYKHHVVAGDPGFANEMLDGRPLYPQRAVQVPATIFSGGRNTAKFQGKMLWYQHTHDTAVWPAPAFYYRDEIVKAQGETGAHDRYRLRFTEYAHHIPAPGIPKGAAPVPTTRLIDYMPQIEQGLHDLVAWVEKGVEPAQTNADYRDGKVVLPPTATQRGGIQPVVRATANGSPRADVKPGQPVAFAVDAEVPPGAGTLIAVEWDFDGAGAYPFKHPGIDGKAKALKLDTTHAFDKPGTYFAAVRVVSHRDGDVAATSCRIENLGRVRVVVT